MSKMDEMDALTAELEGQFSSSPAAQTRKRLRAAHEAPGNTVESPAAAHDSWYGGDWREADWYSSFKHETTAEEEEEIVEPARDQYWREEAVKSEADKQKEKYFEKYSSLWGEAELPELKARFAIQAEVGGHHPWTGGVHGRSGKREGLPAHEIENLRTEQGISAHCGVSWRDRGPKASHGEPTWRGQALRTGKEPKL